MAHDADQFDSIVRMPRPYIVRQRKTRRGADAFFAFQPQFAAVRVDQTLRDGEAEAVPAARAGLVGAIEALAHARQLVGGNADAFIDHLNQHQPIGRGRDAQRDRSAGARILDRVVQEIEQHLLDAIGIGPGGRHFGIDLDSMVRSCACGLFGQPIGHGLHQTGPCPSACGSS